MDSRELEKEENKSEGSAVMMLSSHGVMNHLKACISDFFAPIIKSKHACVLWLCFWVYFPSPYVRTAGFTSSDRILCVYGIYSCMKQYNHETSFCFSSLVDATHILLPMFIVSIEGRSKVFLSNFGPFLRVHVIERGMWSCRTCLDTEVFTSKLWGPDNNE